MFQEFVTKYTRNRDQELEWTKQCIECMVPNHINLNRLIHHYPAREEPVQKEESASILHHKFQKHSCWYTDLLSKLLFESWSTTCEKYIWKSIIHIFKILLKNKCSSFVGYSPYETSSAAETLLAALQTCCKMGCCCSCEFPLPKAVQSSYLAAIQQRSCSGTWNTNIVLKRCMTLQKGCFWCAVHYSKMAVTWQQKMALQNGCKWMHTTAGFHYIWNTVGGYS